MPKYPKQRKATIERWTRGAVALCLCLVAIACSASQWSTIYDGDTPDAPDLSFADWRQALVWATGERTVRPLQPCVLHSATHAVVSNTGGSIPALRFTSLLPAPYGARNARSTLALHCLLLI